MRLPPLRLLLPLALLTADCAPVLLADPGAGVIGAAHAGWRGALEGVLEAVVAAMAGLGGRPGRTVAAPRSLAVRHPRWRGRLGGAHFRTPRSSAAKR